MLKDIFQSRADAVKISLSYLVGVAALSYCFCVAYWSLHSRVQALICVLGGTIGWCIGLYLTPSSEGEKKQFSEVGKLLLTLFSGVGIGKADSIIEFVKGLPVDEQKALAVAGILFLCTLLIGALFVYISRLFVKGDIEVQRERRAKTIAELKETIDRLEKQNQ